MTNNTEPTYDALLRPGRGGGSSAALTAQIMQMVPGDILDAGEYESATKRKRIAAHLTARGAYVREHSPHRYAMRRIGDRLFVVCVKPEDYMLADIRERATAEPRNAFRAAKRKAGKA